MASHFFSRVRYLHSLRSALLRSHPSPLGTLPIPSPLPFSYRLLRQTPAFPSPRLFSCSSSASVTNEEAVYSEAEDRKVENGDVAPDGDKKALSELFKRRWTAGTDPENGMLRRRASGPRGEKRKTGSSEMVGEKELREETDEMKKVLRAVEQTLKNSKEEPADKPKSLTSLFAASDRKARTSDVESRPVSVRSSNSVATNLFSSEDVSANDFSPELISFVELLIEQGHMQKANFLIDGKLEVNSLCSSYARDFVRSAAEQFARGHQEIAKGLSGSELKKVAFIGCPQVDRKTTFSAKRLRSFFEIQENNVCEACQLKELCSFKNKGVQTQENLNLVDVLRVLTIYALNSTHSQLDVSREAKESVSKLLKEVVDLSK